MPVCATSEQAVKIAQKILKGDGPFTIEQLSGGLSGSLIVKVESANQACVVRFWNMRWVDYFPQDFAGQMVASDAGYGPKVLFSDETACITAMEYLRPEGYPPIEERLKALAELLQKIHTGPVVPQGMDKPRELEDLINEVVVLNPQFLNTEAIRAIADTVYSATCPNAKSVPCHRDLHPGNIIYTKGRFIAIDYTWAGMDDPYSDLATIAVFNCQSPEQEKLLLRLYLGREPSATEMARLSLMILPTKIFYGCELLKLAPASAMTNKTAPKATPKCYRNFGCHGAKTIGPADYLEYAVSILFEVIEYSCDDQYNNDLTLLRTVAL